MAVHNIGRNDFSMAIVIRNREGYYITHDSNGKIIKTRDIAQAEDFEIIQRAIDMMQCNSSKTKRYYVYDTSTYKICYGYRRVNNYVKKPKRKQYPKAVKKMLYNQAEGRCQLCGRKILLSEATYDHIIPLSVGGIDDVDNLQIACHICNYTKNSYLPDEFQDRVFDTLCYQMEKKFGNSLKWKFVRSLLMKMV